MGEVIITLGEFGAVRTVDENAPPLRRGCRLDLSQIATDFVNDTALFDRWVPASGSDEERVRSFIE
ncbi:MAG: hypothetical protein AAGJ87_14305, partial [Pseudomonadota bacterium]